MDELSVWENDGGEVGNVGDVDCDDENDCRTTTVGNNGNEDLTISIDVGRGMRCDT